MLALSSCISKDNDQGMIEDQRPDIRPDISIGQRLRYERHYLKLSQEALADLLGTTTRSIRRWEQNATLPQPFYREKLCQLFKKEAKVLFPTKEQENENHIVITPQWNLSHRRNPLFTGREQVFHQMQEALEQGWIAALTGIGGIGKTQTAIEYVYRYAYAYQTVLWVNAESWDTLQTSFVHLAALLSLSAGYRQDLHQLIGIVRKWLLEHTGWLLLFDNVEDLSTVTEVLPTKYEGHVILTTCLQSTGTLAQQIDLRNMTPEEGALLLLRRAKLASKPSFQEASREYCEMAREVSILLGGLPLALDQAGAYIEETGCSLQMYRDLYKQRAPTLLARRGESDPAYPYSVSTTLTLSFKRVEQAYPAAADFLRLCAFLHPDAIPEALIVQGAIFLGPVLGPAVADPLQLNEIFAILGRFSLVRRSFDTRTISLHQLLLVVLRDQMEKQTQRMWAERTILIVNHMLPDMQKHDNWFGGQAYFSQAHVCSALIQSFNLISVEAGRLLCQTGIFLREFCRYTEAETLLEKSQEIFVNLLGHEHSLVALNFNELATVYYKQGEYSKAECLYLQTLALRKRLLGSEDPEVAQTLSNLAELYNYQGKFAQAEEYLLQALAIKDIDGSEEDLQTAELLGNLAKNYGDRGDYFQGELLQRRALVLHERFLGPSHPKVAQQVYYLGYLCHMLGEYSEAESLLKQAISRQKKIFGLKHAVVAISLSSLARNAAAQGRFAEAEAIRRHVLALREQLLGPDHPSLATSLSYLAVSYIDQGRYDEAEPLIQRALSIRKQRLGPNNARTARSLWNLGRLYTERKQMEQAECLFQQALAIQEQTLGPDHPDFASTLLSLAYLFSSQGRYHEAKPMYHRAITIIENKFGSEHPELARALDGIADFYRLLEQYNQAKQYYIRALRIWESRGEQNCNDAIKCAQYYTALLHDIGQGIERE